MKNTVVLDMLNKGQIEQLKQLLEDEIYTEALNSKTGAKKRYNAMKKYFSYHKASRECLQKPCVIEYENKFYTCFTNSWSLVLTTEDTGEIELFDETNGKYPNVTRLIHFEGIKKKIDFNKVIAEAKSKGYRLNKTEVGAGFTYLMHYDGGYYKIGLLDATYRIINDGEPVMTYHPDGEKQPLTFQNDIGFGIIMPVFMHDREPDESHVIIEVR